MDSPIRLISTDFDGTIYAEFENPAVPEALQELLGEFQSDGGWWVINTGRDLSSLMEALARARLTVRPDYLVLVEREIFVHTDSRYVGVEDWNRRCTAAHGRLFDRVRPDLPRLNAWINGHYEADVYEAAWSPLCVVAQSLADAEAIQSYLERYCREVPDLAVMRNDVYSRFSHAAFNKGTALTEIARRLGIGREAVFAAGDHLNDLPMLSRAHAGWLAAPANAIPEVKERVREEGGHVSDRPHGYGVQSALGSAFQSEA